MNAPDNSMIKAIICVSFLILFAGGLHAQESQGEELLELPSFNPDSTSTRPSSPVQLQLLTRDELRSLYSNNIPAPQKKKPAPKDGSSLQTANTVADDNSTGQGMTSSADEQKDALASGWNSGSMMFSEDDLLQLQIALAKYYRSRQDSLYNQKTGAEGEPQNRAREKLLYPVIFTGSILYISPKQWSTWINGRKFSYNQPSPLPGISVKSITRNTVTLFWRPGVRLNAELADSSHIKKVGLSSYEVTMQANDVLVTHNLSLEEGKVLTQDIVLSIKQSKELPKKQDDDVNLEELGINPAKPVDPDRMNMNRLIDQYRKAQETTQ